MNERLCVIDSALGAVENLARNEACLESVRKREHSEIVRIYSFTGEGVILSKYQHHDDLHDHAWVNCEVTRRKTGGGAVYVDAHTLGYSVFGRMDGVVGSVSNPIDVPYKRMRSAVMDALKSFGLNPREERHWGVRLENGVVAGHAQRFDNGVYEVHGLLRLRKWDMEKVAGAIKMRTMGARDEYQELARGPDLEGMDVARGRFIEELTARLSDAKRTVFPESLLARAVHFENEYRDPVFVRGKDDAKRQLGHCFVDLE